MRKLTEGETQIAYEACGTGLLALGLGLALSVGVGLAAAGAWILCSILWADRRGEG